MGRLPWESGRIISLAICAALVGITVAVFGQTLRHDFVNFDDNLRVYDNPQVREGVTRSGIAWAFGHQHGGHWVPLTTLSHMLDCSLYGLDAGGHHLTNLLLHAATALLLYLVLSRATAATWPSAFVAAVFAIHPLRVESVAWVAERKDLLSGFFFVLTLCAYVWYVRGGASPRRYLLVLITLALGLLSKFAVATTPLVLLLLDYWPLRRFKQSPPGTGMMTSLRSSGFTRLLVEKLPLLVPIGVAVLGMTVAQLEGPAIPTTLEARPGYALATPVVYLKQMLYPRDLVVHAVPNRGGVGSEALVAVLVLVALSVVVVRMRSSAPYALIGWFWYLGMVLPIVALIFIGSQLRCDRYTYLSQIGLYVAIAWALRDACSPRRWCASVIGCVALAIVGVLAYASRAQTAHWRDSLTLWRHVLSVGQDNVCAQSNLGHALLKRGNVDEALKCFNAALSVDPKDVESLNSRGVALALAGHTDEALRSYEAALRVHPRSQATLNNIGDLLNRGGQVDAAEVVFRQVLLLNPHNSEALNNLGVCLLKKGLPQQAMLHLDRGIEVRSDYAIAHNNLAACLHRLGRVDDALSHVRRAVEIDPDYAPARNNYGNLLHLAGHAEAALTQYAAAVELQPSMVAAQSNLAALTLELAGRDQSGRAGRSE